MIEKIGKLKKESELKILELLNMELDKNPVNIHKVKELTRSYSRLKRNK